jgi:hypothetical protein
MDYLAILKNLDSGKADARSMKAVAEEPCNESNELNEKRPVHAQEPVERAGCPGPEQCAGCYSVGVIDGRERFIHPPKASADWEAWLKRWGPKGRIQ